MKLFVTLKEAGVISYPHIDEQGFVFFVFYCFFFHLLMF